MNTAHRNNIEYSRSLQEKYEYYLAALNFTILALSVQTAEFTSNKVTTSLELLGWSMLLIGGFIALSRFEMQPLGHENFSILDEEKKRLSAIRKEKVVVSSDTGQVIDTEQLTKKIENMGGKK